MTQGHLVTENTIYIRRFGKSFCFRFQ